MATDRRFAVVTSPLGRARATAQRFVDRFCDLTGGELTAEVSELFIEMSFGEADGHSLDDMRSIGRDDLIACTERYRCQDATVRFPRGESFLDAMDRAVHAAAYINSRFKTESLGLLAVYSHGRFSSALRAVVGDTGVLAPSGQIEFRARALDHAAPYWLPVAGRAEPDDQPPNQRTLS